MLQFEALVIAILGLVPGQSPTTFAVVNAVAAQLATLPVIAAGASLLARGGGGGLYWLVLGILLLLGVGVSYAWVLLVEILR